jgi:hypothetical protein
MMCFRSPKYRVGEPVTAPIVPNPLDRVELGAVRRQRQQGDIAGHHEPFASVPAGSVEDHQGMGIGGNITWLLISFRWWFIAAVLQIGMISAAALPADGQTAPNR